MKKLTARILCLLMLSAALPALADDGYIGNMEVVNCSEWVSLREKPSTRAKRLVKVSLGAIVRHCRQVNQDWICAEYDGYSGYILDEYLEPSDGRITFSAMMITITGEGAPLFATLDSEEPFAFIPPSTIVRSCRMMDNGRIYVEWGDRCGFIRSEHAEVYSEMIHYPPQMTLLCNLFSGAFEGPAPALKIADLQDFPITAYDYSSFESDDYMAADDEALPKAAFVLHSDKPVSKVHLFSVSMQSMDADTGETIFDAALEHVQPQVDPAHPLFVGAVIWGDMPNLAVGYEDEAGLYRFAFVEISGVDGSFLLREF